MKSKTAKQFEQEKLVASVIADIRLVSNDMSALSADYARYAVEAAGMDQSAYADELLEASVDIDEFIEDLKFFELKIRQTAITAKSFATLAKLPEALSACKRIFCEAPNLKKLGRDMSSLLHSMGSARQQFKDFRTNLSHGSDPIYAEIFGRRSAADDPKRRQRLEAKKKALEAQLAVGVAAPTPAEATTPKAAATPADKAAGIDDIARLLDDERGRK